MCERKRVSQQGKTLTFFPTCPVGQVGKKSACPTAKRTCPNKMDLNVLLKERQIKTVMHNDISHAGGIKEDNKGDSFIADES